MPESHLYVAPVLQQSDVSTCSFVLRLRIVCVVVTLMLIHTLLNRERTDMHLHICTHRTTCLKAYEKMGLELQGGLTTFLALFYSLVLFLFVEHCSAAGDGVMEFTAKASGRASARTVVCEPGGTKHVATLDETISYNASSFSSFTLKCRGAQLELLPRRAADYLPYVCADSSTLDSCTQITLEELHIAAAVDATVTQEEKSAQWAIWPNGFPRAPQRFKVGCVVRHAASAEEPQGPSNEHVDLQYDPGGEGGCLVTVEVSQAPPIIENNVVECTYGRGRTVTPIVSVTPKVPYVGIRCGLEISFVPPDGRYCADEELEECEPRSLGVIFPNYSDSWWETDADGKVLTIPLDQFPTNRKILYFGCALAEQIVDPDDNAAVDEDYYCVVPVLFHNAAYCQQRGKPLSGGIVWEVTLLLFLSFFSLISGA